MSRLSVSVVIPCFRCAATIDRAISSVLAQTRLPDELIVVDDASPDASWNDVLRALDGLPSGIGIRTIKLARNVGAAQARNAGWDTASGDVIAFLDADDSWHPRKLELQLEVMHEQRDVAVCGHQHVVREGLADGWPIEVRSPVTRITFQDLLWRNRFTTSSVMLRRTLPLRFPTGQRHMEDHRLWLELASGGHATVRLESPLAAHHKADFGVSGLSADMWAMERAELSNYRALSRRGLIGKPLYCVLMLWSLAKYIRRILMLFNRRSSIR